MTAPTAAPAPARTTVGIVGAGPAGLLLARLLHAAGIDCVVLESRDRGYVEQRQRAGILEQGTVDVLRESGAAERLDREGLPHDGIELRFDGRAHRIDFPALTGGRRVWVYAQTEVVKDLVALQLADGAPLVFEAQVTGIDGADSSEPTVRYLHQGAEHRLVCDYVVGCDGFHGVVREAIPANARQTFERTYPYSWLGILADVAPSTDELIYAWHPDGFGMHSMRSATVSRLYLQVPNGTDVADWSDDRIWTALATRLGHGQDGWTLTPGPITDKSVLPMRSFVQSPMRHGRLFLAGDAAHTVPPTGAKGLNLAIADVALLAPALGRLVRKNDLALADAYSDTALRRVWRCEHFSWWMTTMLHISGDPFDAQLQLSQLRWVTSSAAGAAGLAENYAGLPIGF
jgi:p-hydroxybenzoate 3-monooxygenase